MKRKLLLLSGVMLCISLIGAIMINLFSTKQVQNNVSGDDKVKIVATFYPVYLIAQNLAGSSDDIEVKSLTDLNTGCLHDYQLTTEDMKLISDADVLVINGGGMEAFLEDVMANYPDLTIIDASEGIKMLEEESEAELGIQETSEDQSTTDKEEPSNEETSDPSDGETVEPSDEDTDNSLENRSDENAAEPSEGLSDDGTNAHVWLDPERYIRQVENVRDGLLEYIDNTIDNSALSSTVLDQTIIQNAEVYMTEIKKINQEYSDLLSGHKASVSARAVIFHDSFAYLAEKAGIEVRYTVPLDSDTSLSAGDIATIIDAVKRDNVKYLFTEEQYSDSIAKQIEAETEAKVYIIDSVVTGSGEADSYLKAMNYNLEVISEAVNTKK